MRYPIIADSGANYLFYGKGFFTSLLPASGEVIHGDDKTTFSIKGVGIVQCCIDGRLVSIDNV
jgi:hypothetical protein